MHPLEVYTIKLIFDLFVLDQSESAGTRTAFDRPRCVRAAKLRGLFAEIFASLVVEMVN